MRDILGESLKNLKRIKTQQNRLHTMLLVLSLIVSLNVFWALRQPGLTLAGDATCGILEHTHSEECFTLGCICQLPEEAHIHSEACYTTEPAQMLEQLSLVCTQTEDPHDHGDGCYTTQLTEAAAFLQLICSQTDETHVHEDSCYERVTAEPVEETVLNCDLAVEPHEHTENCYTLEVVEIAGETVLICPIPEAVFIHEDDCRAQESACQLPQHVHSIECYSDSAADTETLLDWQDMFADYPYTGDLRRDLVGIAKTQVGYAESARNFQVDSNGIRRGYTRYGAWYGTPYRDWSAAFVSFCLNYAGADPSQTPGNIGANAMASLWKSNDRFVPAGEYVPAAGDLVFFRDNTVAIVSEVYSTTFYFIRGDMDDAVGTDSLLLNDESITGWGLTVVDEEDPTAVSPEEPASAPAEDPTEVPTEEPVGLPDESTVTELTWRELLDISNGPVFFLLTNGEPLPQIRTYSFRNTRTVKELLSYLEEVGGDLSYRLFTDNDILIQPDEDDHYTLDTNLDYKLHLRINSANGLHPGTYVYQLPQGLVVNPGGGTFELKDADTGLMVEVGDWNVTSDGLITLNFNQNMESQSGISIPATVGIQFKAQDEPIDFDGIITVTVNPPPDLEEPTILEKWGLQGYEENKEGKTDRSKIYWSIKITGQQDSQIPGNILTDKVVTGDWYGDHRYTESDIAAGLRFDVTDPNGVWHHWTVYEGDPGLVWTESGWSYSIPETVICQDGEELTLGNDGWVYLINYTTTPDHSDNDGSLTYANQVKVDWQTFDGYIKFQHGDLHGEIQKTGSFQADAEGGAFHWEITAIIPGITENQFARFWDITDTMNVYDNNGNWVDLVTNDADKATVTATHNGNTVVVNHVFDAAETDPFAWYVSWSDNNNPSGIYNVRSISLLHRCACTQETCPWWGTGCGSYPWLYTDARGWYQDEHFCRCWTTEGTTTFTLTYETTDLSIIEEHGGIGDQLRNYAELFYVPDGDESKVFSAGRAPASVTIPGLFKKALTQDFNGYTAHYQITVNEAKLSLTNGSALHIRDEMTDTLAFISGSLVITAEDADGNITILQQGVDYTYTYDGSGTATNSNKDPIHLLGIDILHAQPVKYTIDYDATLVLADLNEADVAYSNSASVTLWGKEFTDDSPQKVYTEFSITGESYKVQLNKTCATTGDPLGGATFGLFNTAGGQITMGVTEADGQLSFKTNIVQGIILRSHELYYMQELQAPPGYELDDRPHWFVFCNNAAATCDQCAAAMGKHTATRIPYNQIRIIDISNNPISYHLPATGGPGILPLILVSVLFIITPLVYISVQRRKRERRDDG